MRVSVIIPCYNRASVVAETIRCVLAQTLPPHEVIAVDDGSTDNTVEVLQSFGSRVRILRQSNAGASAARNAGLKIAGGDLIWFMDSDDLASLNKLEVQVRALQQSAADIAFAPWIKCRLQDSHAHPETHILQQRGLPRAMARALVSRWTVVLQAGLFRKGLLSAVGGFDTSYDVAEDQLLFLKCLLAGARIVHTPECLVVYRTDSSNKLTETAVTSETRFVSWARFLFEARQLCEEAGVHVSGSLPFRLRLWCAWKDLSRCSSSGARELAALLASGLGLPWVGPFYALAQKGAHWQGGLRQRIFGDRSPLALRAGPPRQDQLSLISELGYALQA